MTGDWRVWVRSLHGDVRKGVFTEYAASVEIGGEERRLTDKSLGRGQAAHVGDGEKVLQIVVRIANVGVDVHLTRRERRENTINR